MVKICQQQGRNASGIHSLLGRFRPGSATAPNTTTNPQTTVGSASCAGSLGVEEHWNNAEDGQYSRNLGTGKEIELIRLVPENI